MKKSEFPEEHVAYALRLAESGTPVGDVCRQMGISEATFYVSRKRCADLGVAAVAPAHRRERTAQAHRGRSHAGQADSAEGHQKRSDASAEEGNRIVDARAILSRHCALAKIIRANCYYRSRAKDQWAVRMRIRTIANARPRSGYERITVLLHREGCRQHGVGCPGGRAQSHLG